MYQSDLHPTLLQQRGFGGAADAAVKQEKNITDGEAQESKKLKRQQVVNAEPQWGAPASGKARRHNMKKKDKEVVQIVETAAGEKKDVTLLMSDFYEPREVESASADDEETMARRLIMAIPPPNAAGFSDVSHALTCSREDAIARWHRMQGDVARREPGRNQAGIGTQAMVEPKQIAVQQAGEDQMMNLPQGVMDCGADVLRCSLLACTQQGSNVNLDTNCVVANQHFCDKVWNATRFALKHFPEDFTFTGALSPGLALSWEDKWILSRLSNCAREANQGFKNYEFADYTASTQSFFADEFCDIYLELLKPRLEGEAANGEVLQDRKAAYEVLYVCLDHSFRVMHPLLPHLTEELFQRLPPSPVKAESICISSFPKEVDAWTDLGVEEEMNVVREAVQNLRLQRVSLGLKPGDRPKGFVWQHDPESASILERLATKVCELASYSAVSVW